MNLNLTPTKVNIDIESLSLERDAFYNACFITESETAPRTIEVSKLKDLLDNDYDRFSLAYNFCVGALSQQGISSIKIRAKRLSESYEDAFDADDNTGYYFLVIESKDKVVVREFNNYITTSDDYKLLFYSSPEEAMTNSELVQYYQTSLSNSDLINDKVTISDYYINKAFNTSYDDSGIELATVEQLQQARLSYPEAAWISLCGNKFPSSVQWLYKYLAKVDINEVKTVPDLSSTTSTVISNKATVGSGCTTYGTPIHEKVSIDWVKWALSRKVWNTLYTKEKINATQGGLDLIINDIKMVLDLAVQESMFIKYQITETKLDRNTNTIQVKFTAELTHTILEVEVNGSLRY